MTDGWVVSFTEDVAEALGERSGEALTRLKALAAEPVVPLADAAEIEAALRALRRSARGSASWRAKAFAWRCAGCWR